MEFSSSGDKNKIGKRREVAGKSASRHMGGKQPTGHTDLLDANHSGPCMSGALKKGDDDISIRIGTDALAVPTPTQHCRHAPWQPVLGLVDSSSDFLLFDHEHLFVALGEPLQPMTPTKPEPYQAVRLPTKDHGESRSLSFSAERTSGRQSTRRRHLNGFTSSGAGAKTDGVTKQSPADSPTAQIMQHIKGAEHTLGFFFDRSSDHLHLGGATHRYDTAHAGQSASGHAAGDTERSSLNFDSAHPPAAIDNGLWRPFLAIPHGRSSRSATARIFESDQSYSRHILPKDQNGQAELIVSSQHAARGDRTGTGSSPFSSALLSSTRQCKLQSMSRDKSQGIAIMSKPEELWRSFILGGGHVLASEMVYGNHIDENNKSKNVAGPPSRWPRSLAVALRVSEDVETAASRTPRSTSLECMRAISSPEVPCVSSCGEEG